MRVALRKDKKCISIVLVLALSTLAILNSAGRDSTNEGYEMIDSHEPIIVEFPLRGE
jgi:hypothetical protein